ncbi:hypothetical protein [Aeromicrobium sp. IC_218]|uniref:hypothetical protein n=1 Tax=Aeromicrobium sp. IC_218 TaxID=2545468 RepID=UPI00103C9CED|nr:hypothetical protein [Aeromicrobium sp. IC_218]TCI99524.1 hypothetical protein E0W78_07260 [Aeromicrobium sp. IC_218]
MNRRLAALLLPVVTAGSLVLAAPAAHAAPDCSDAGDVAVVVDYKELGADPQILCAEDADGSTVLETLRTAGLRTAGTTNEGDAALCRVEDLPSPQDEDCRTYSDEAYWAISLAGPDADAWSYAQKGVAEQTVEGGGYVGLSYEPITADANAAAAPSVLPGDEVRAQLEADAEADEPAGDEAVEEEDSSTPSTVALVVGAVLVVALVAAIVAASRRRRG